MHVKAFYLIFTTILEYDRYFVPSEFVYPTETTILPHADTFPKTAALTNIPDWLKINTKGL